MAKSVIAPPNFITFKALSAYFLPTGSKSKQYNNTLSLRDTVPVVPWEASIIANLKSLGS